jgi:hypothetical protein
MKGRYVPVDIKVKHLKRGDIVKLRKGYDIFTTYGWHVDNQNVHYYGIITTIHDGLSYCIIKIKILYPDRSRDDWSKQSDWIYGKEDIEEVVDISKIPPQLFDKLLARVM